MKDQPTIDLLQRVLVPIEKVTKTGTRIFRTTDKQMYVRMEDGSIHRVHSVNKNNLTGKAARRAQKKQRRLTQKVADATK